MYTIGSRTSPLESSVREFAAVSLTHHPNHPNTAQALGELGFLYLRSGRYSDAVPAYTNALEIFNKQDRFKVSPDKKRAINGLTYVQANLGKAREVASLFETILEDFPVQITGHDATEELCVADYASNLLLQGYDRSAADTLKSLVRRISSSSILWKEIPKLNFNLASALSSSGQYVAADHLLKIIEKDFFDSEAPQNGRVEWLNLAGMTNYRAGHLLEAVRRFAEARLIARKDLGESSELYAIVLSNQALAQAALGPVADRQLAIGAIQQAESITLSLLPDSDELARVLNIKGYLAAMGYLDNDPAISYERALQLRRRLLGIDHPKYALVLNNRAHWRHSNGDVSDAVTDFETAFALAGRRLTKDHPIHRVIQSNINFIARRKIADFGLEALIPLAY